MSDHDPVVFDAEVTKTTVNDSATERVVSVVLTDTANVSESIPAGQELNGRGTLGLCPPPTSEVVSVVFPGKSEVVSHDVDTVELPEALRLLPLVGTDDDPYRAGGPWAYADAEDLGGRVFFVTQNERYLDTETELISEDRIASTLAKKGMTRWAWIKHDQDVYTVDEAAKIPGAVAGSPKSNHYHIAVMRKSFSSLGVIARAFGVPPNAVEIKPQGSYFDLVEYLTHEHQNQQTKGKHLYPDDRVHANFDWRTELNDHKLARSYKAGQRANQKRFQQICIAVNRGEMTLSQIRDNEPEIYTSRGTLAHLQKLRGDYLTKQDAPEQVINFYIFGPGGVGKDLMAKALARSLAPEYESPYFKLGGENVSWEGYDGEPVVIWEDMRVNDMMRVAKSRGMLFRILGPWREKTEAPIVNIKNSRTQLLNRYNIVTGPQDYGAFLRGLAGEYESMQGGIRVRHDAENLAQGYRRFPVVIPVHEQEFSIYVNQGVMHGTRDYMSYARHERLRQSLEMLNRRCAQITDAADRERVRQAVEQATVAPIVGHVDQLRLTPDDAVVADAVLSEFRDAGRVIEPDCAQAMAAQARAAHDTVQLICTDEHQLAQIGA